MKKLFYIFFAGPIGSSKSPIANYLSWNLNVPVFNTDCIRSEIHEDLLINTSIEEVYSKVKEERLNLAKKKGWSLIFDNSIDRQWSTIKKELTKNRIPYFIISIDISKEHLKKLYESKGYLESIKHIDNNYQDHLEFLKDYSKDIGLHITDNNFKHRLELSLISVKDFIGK